MESTALPGNLSFLPLELSILTEKIIHKAEEELGETKQKRKECLEEFKKMIRKEKNLDADTRDEFLLIFLRTKKFRLDAAFKVLKKYYLNRKTYSNLYEKFSPEHCREVLQAKFLNFLPLRSPEGASVWVPRIAADIFAELSELWSLCCLIFVSNKFSWHCTTASNGSSVYEYIGSWDTKMFTPEEITRTGLVCLEKEMKNPVTQVCGMVVLIDLKGFSWSHMSQISLKNLKCFIDTVQDGLPVRHKAMHIINNPSIFGTIFNTVKPFLSEKIKKRVYFHGDDLSSLHQFLPPEMLPEEFGGTQGPFGNERFYQSLLDSEEEYKKCQQYGYVAVKM